MQIWNRARVAVGRTSFVDYQKPGSKHGIVSVRGRFYVRFFSRDNDREFVERNGIRIRIGTNHPPTPLAIHPLSSSLVLIVDRRLKFRQGRTMFRRRLNENRFLPINFENATLR